MITVNIKESNMCNGKASLYLSFPYDEKVIGVIRSMPSRYWNKDNKEWELPYKTLPAIISDLSDYQFDINLLNPDLIVEPKDIDVTDIISGFNFKTKPYQHQIDGFKYGLQYDKWLLGDEQGLGKALALNTKVYTPNGYKLIRDIQVGDVVFGKNGKPTRVTATYNHKNVEMYRITFSDGVSIDCCKDHLWQIHDRHGTKIIDTKWFTEKDQFGNVRKDNLFSSGSRSYKYWIDRCEPVQFEYKNIPVDPYVLGALLGDGGLTSNSVFFTTADREMVNAINDRLPSGYSLYSAPSMNDIEFYIKGVQGKTNIIKKGITELGLWGTNSHTKFIPDVYKYNSISVRTEILQGLIDTDGYATKDNLLQYTTVSKQLCEDVRFLVESLGGVVRYSEKDCKCNGKTTGICYTLTIKFDRPQLYCTLTRKKSLLKDRRFKARRNIISIERIENADAKCITVDNEDSLYLIDHFVVTHNTKEVIDIAVAKKLQKGYKHCLIICGVNGLKWNWVNEVSTHSDEESHILGQRTRANKTVIGSNADKVYDIEHIDDIDAYFIITNVESLRSEDIVKGLSKLCDNGIINMVAADECHKMKNPTSQQGKGFLKIQAETMIAMTGTPLMNNPMDLYIILKWLGYEKHAFYSFKKHYCVMGGFGGYEIIGYQNLSELQAQLNDIMLRRKKDEVLDLPEKTYVDEYVEMTKAQRLIYNEVTAEIKMNIDQIKTAPNPLAELIRMRQATGYTGILSSTITESAKLDRMEELVEDAVENGKKVVIFSNWTQITDIVKSRLAKKYKGVVITGNTVDAERQVNVNHFQNNDDCKYIVGTIGAMGTGLNLFEGSVIIFVDHPWTRAAYDQAVDRCHRIGQTRNLTIYNLLCKDTIDERIWALVNKKGRMSDALIDGQIVGNKSALIDYLLD